MAAVAVVKLTLALPCFVLIVVLVTVVFFGGEVVGVTWRRHTGERQRVDRDAAGIGWDAYEVLFYADSVEVGPPDACGAVIGPVDVGGIHRWGIGAAPRTGNEAVVGFVAVERGPPDRVRLVRFPNR